ncbi:MAG: hypothetical protein H7124_16560 [Phycisphaerales bacterium]|nr:hypothetical protein [Hyphomonadaceae bacterium]
MNTKTILNDPELQNYLATELFPGEEGLAILCEGVATPAEVLDRLQQVKANRLRRHWPRYLRWRRTGAVH